MSDPGKIKAISLSEFIAATGRMHFGFKIVKVEPADDVWARNVLPPQASGGEGPSHRDKMGSPGAVARRFMHGAEGNPAEVETTEYYDLSPNETLIRVVVDKGFPMPELQEKARPLDEFDLSDDSFAIVVRDPASTDIGSLVTRWAEGLDVSTRDEFERVVEALMPPDLLSSPAVVEQARRNAAARTEFLNDLPTAGGAEVADLAGSRSANRASLAHGWRKAGRIFAITVSGAARYPLFQFDPQGRPRPVIARVLEHLRSLGSSDWEIALWFTGPLASLDNRRPLDLIEEDPEALVAAAATASEFPF